MKIVLQDRYTIPEYEFLFSFSRSSGPGGQNVNKVNSRATLRWNLWLSPSIPDGVKRRFFAKYGSRVKEDGEFSLSSDRYREQLRNKEDCVLKLQEMLLEVLVPPKRRRATKPTRAAKRRRLDTKKKQSDKKKGRQTKNWD